MKKIIFILFLILFYKIKTFAVSEEEIIPDYDSIINITWWWTSMVDNIINSVIWNMFSLLSVVVIWIFIYVWFLFITSSGDKEQFKKAWKIFLYTIIWLVIIILSLWVVRLISSIGI